MQDPKYKYTSTRPKNDTNQKPIFTGTITNEINSIDKLFIFCKTKDNVEIDDFVHNDDTTGTTKNSPNT